MVRFRNSTISSPTKRKGEGKKVSIILPTYNGVKYIKQSIDSCLTQTYKNLELIIVDDGSSGGISKIIHSYRDPRIKYFRHKRNLGLAYALNTGFSNAAGEYLTWTSDDNFYSPIAINSMVKVLETNPKVDFVYANYYIINEKGEKLKSVKVKSIKNLDKYNCIGSCFLYKRKIYEKIGEFNPDFPLAQDYEYWLRVRKEFRMQKLNKLLYYYRRHRESLRGRHELVKIEEEAERASNKYICPSAKYYHQAKVYFYKKNYHKAKERLVKSLILNPLNFNAWRLLAFLFLYSLNHSIAEKILEKLRK